MYQMCRIDLEMCKRSPESLRNEIEILADKIRQKWDVDRIILYGSVARGDFNEGSDVDLLVVAGFKERFHKRAAEITEMTVLPVEPVCYTREEFQAMIKNKNSFVLSVIEEGILI